MQSLGSHSGLVFNFHFLGAGSASFPNGQTTRSDDLGSGLTGVESSWNRMRVFARTSIASADFSENIGWDSMARLTWSDSVTVLNATEPVRLVINYEIHGTRSSHAGAGSIAGSQLKLILPEPQEALIEPLTGKRQTFSIDINGLGPAQLAFALEVVTSMDSPSNPGFVSEGGWSEADYEIQVHGVEVRTPDGRLQSGASVISAGGNPYHIIPEPPVTAMLGFAFFLGSIVGATVLRPLFCSTNSAARPSDTTLSNTVRPCY